MSPRDLALRVAWHYLGTPYRWGGDDPSGLDCSGLVIEVLQSAGVFPRGQDTTADGLMRKYEPKAAPEPADLIFWRTSGSRAFHVGIVIDPRTHYLGAEGGGSRTKTEGDAWAQNAYVCVRPIASRPGNIVYRDPFA